MVRSKFIFGFVALMMSSAASATEVVGSSVVVHGGTTYNVTQGVYFQGLIRKMNEPHSFMQLGGDLRGTQMLISLTAGLYIVSFGADYALWYRNALVNDTWKRLGAPNESNTFNITRLSSLGNRTDFQVDFRGPDGNIWGVRKSQPSKVFMVECLLAYGCY